MSVASGKDGSDTKHSDDATTVVTTHHSVDVTEAKDDKGDNGSNKKDKHASLGTEDNKAPASVVSAAENDDPPCNDCNRCRLSLKTVSYVLMAFLCIQTVLSILFKFRWPGERILCP